MVRPENIISAERRQRRKAGENAKDIAKKSQQKERWLDWIIHFLK